MVHSLKLEEEEKQCVVLVHTLLADDSIKRVFSLVLETHIIADLNS